MLYSQELAGVQAVRSKAVVAHPPDIPKQVDSSIKAEILCGDIGILLYPEIFIILAVIQRIE